MAATFRETAEARVAGNTIPATAGSVINKEQYGIDVDKKRIKLEEPIKSLGITDITAHLYEQTDTKFKVEVLPLEASKN